jgi:AcrR family transcriptional regulator
VERNLEVVGSRPAPPRADATRNRARLLDTARRLVAEGGAEALSMDCLAAAAGLGKGTIFRRFGSRAGLFEALVDDDERAFQAACLSGPPPLGPGADPVTRLVAFGRRRLDLVVEQGALMAASQQGLAALSEHPASLAAGMHVRVLLRAADVRADLDLLAVQLLAALDPPLVLALLRAPAMTLQRLGDGWEDLVRRVTAAG